MRVCMVPLRVTVYPHTISVCKVANPFMYRIMEYVVSVHVDGSFFVEFNRIGGLQPKMEIHRQKLGFNFNFHKLRFCDGYSSTSACFQCGTRNLQMLVVTPIQNWLVVYLPL